MDAKRGVPALNARMAIGTAIMKHMLNIDGRAVLQHARSHVYNNGPEVKSLLHPTGPYRVVLPALGRRADRRRFPIEAL